MRRPGSGSSETPQSASNKPPRVAVRDVAIAGQFVRETAHVARALHIILAAQWVHANAAPSDIAGRHGKIGNRHHGGAALAMFGHAQAVIDRAIAVPWRTAGRPRASLRRARIVTGSSVSAHCAGRTQNRPNG